MKKEAESAVERETERSVIDLEMHEKSTTTTKKKKKKKTKRNENKEEIAEHAVKKHKKLKKEKREGRDEVPLEPVVLPEIDFLPYNVENLELLKETVDGGLFLVRNFIAQHDCVSLLSKLLDEIPFPEERSIILHGLNVPEPRDVCYMGDLDVSNYRYGSIERSAVEWTPTVKALRNSIQRAMEEMEPLKKFRCNINCALLNLYRNGQDSMGEHADDEEELGWRRCIFSLSFGASRNVVFSNARTKETFQTLKINSGDLYIMVGWYFQWRFRHSVVKDETVDEP
jgi:alkylated DNA repair dioxygenase AlkB